MRCYESGNTFRPKVGQQPPGHILADALDELYKSKPLVIVETGCLRMEAPIGEFADGWSTLYIAQWIREHPDCEFHSVDLSANAIGIAHDKLENALLAKYCTFHCQDSLKFLGGMTWIDFAFLDSCDGLEHGVDEFRLAASAGASVIVMDDYQTKAAWAVKEARELGWQYEQRERYSILKRPN